MPLRTGTGSNADDSRQFSTYSLGLESIGF